MELFNSDSQPQLSPLGEQLSNKIRKKDFIVGVVGLGYVGLPIALAYARKGVKVVGVDLHKEKITMLQKGENYIEDLSNDLIKEVVTSGHLSAHGDYDALASCDVIFLCVPTPFNSHKDPDISYILDSGKRTAPNLKKGALVILKSTTFPGTTEEYLIPELESGGLKSGKDFFVAFSPERVDPGNQDFTTENTPIVVGGIDPESTFLCAFANSIIIPLVYQVSNPRIAELEKLLENIFRSVNIALMNELALLSERLPGINIWEVIDAAATKPFGFMKFTPGPGIGGHCIPIDPYYLSWMARKYDFETKFITLSANTNEGMPYYIVHRMITEIARQAVKLEDARILLLGVAFKKNVRDLRNSPAEAIVRRLRDAGLNHLDFTDPHAPGYSVDGIALNKIELTSEALRDYNCTLVVTDHDDFDPEMIVRESQLVYDTRNMTKNVKEGRDKILLLGSTI